MTPQHPKLKNGVSMEASYDIIKNGFEDHKLFGIIEIPASEEILQAFPDQLDDRYILKLSTNSDFLPFYVAEKMAELYNLELQEVPVPIMYGDLPRTKDKEKRGEVIVSKVMEAFKRLLGNEEVVAFLLVYSSLSLGFFALKKGDKMKFEKPKRCLDCLNAKLKDDRVYCYEWGVIVLATHAKICPRFVPRKRRKEKIRKVIRYGRKSKHYHF